MEILKIEELAPSQLLLNFINKVTNETERDLLIFLSDNNFRYPALFYPSEKHITVCITQQVKDNISTFDPILAHELAHGYLKYKYHYGFIQSNQEYMHLASRVQTMIEDIPVQKLIGDYGFPVLPEIFENNILTQVNAIKNGVPPFIFYDQLHHPWNVVHDMILYWGHMKYVPLTKKQTALFNEGLSTLNKICSISNKPTNYRFNYYK